MIQFSIPSFYSSAYLGKLSWFQLLKRLYWADGASVQDGFKSEVLAEFHFQNFMSRADSFSWAALQGSPALSVLYCIHKPLRVWCVCVAATSQKWSFFCAYFEQIGFRHPQGFARNKASAQRRRGSNSQHCWTGLDFLSYFGHLWVLGPWVIIIHLPAHKLQ